MAKLRRKCLGALCSFVCIALPAAAVISLSDSASGAVRHYRVTLSTSAERSALGAVVTFTGKVRPRANGQSVLLQRRSGDGWTTAATIALRRHSTFSGDITMRWTGAQQFRAVKSKASGTQTGVSPTREVQVAAPAWRDVSAGGTHTCGVRGTGTLWCWGEAFDSIDGSHFFKRPHQVGSVSTWTGVVVGVDHACATRTDGSLWCWGNNDFHQLGTTTGGSTTAPVRVGTATDWQSVVPMLDATCGLRAGGTLWCWGYDFGGLLGDGGTAPHGDARRVGADTDWATLTGGNSHTCATKLDGSAWCWGYNFAGAVGDGSTTTRTSPTRVGSSNAWESLAGGGYFTCGLRTGGAAWCWGENNQGQLGDGSETNRLHPVQVPGTWTQLAAADEWTCGLRPKGTAACWGQAYGDVPASAGGTVTWRTLDLGTAHACGVRPNGSAWCFGENYYGQLGDGTTTRRPNAVPVTTPATGYF